MTPLHPSREESIQVLLYAQCADCEASISSIAMRSWPRFILEGSRAAPRWGELVTRFPSLQLVALCSTPDPKVVGYASAVALLARDLPNGLPDGWDDAFALALSQHALGMGTDTVVPLSITVDPAFRGRGVSLLLLRELKAAASRAGVHHLLAPVRPSTKALHPWIPIDAYLAWTTPQGMPFDPWVRTHVRMGGVIKRITRASMVIDAPLGDWRKWTGLSLQAPGPHIVQGAIDPVVVNLISDRARYVEPNVWIEHFPGS